MNKGIAIALFVLGIGAVACSAQAPVAISPSAAPPTTLPHRSGTLRFSLNGVPDVLDVPRLMAIDSLKEQGYNIEQTIFTDGSLVPSAMMRGEIDFGSPNTNVAWSAITKGADIRTIVERANITFYLVVKQEIKTCQDLNGRSIAFGSNTSVASLMFIKYLKQTCPGVQPQIVLISDSNNRVVALQAGQIDGSQIEIKDWIYLNRKEPGKFRIGVDFANEFPQFQYSTFSVLHAWAERNPEIVKDFLRALLTAHRRVIADHQLLRDEIVKYISIDPAEAQEAADAYLALGVWDANGGLTRDNLKPMLDFLSSTGSLPSTLQVDDVADLSYLNAVLDEIGRK